MSFVVLNCENKRLTKFQKIVLCNVIRRMVVHPKNVIKKNSYNAIVKLVVQGYLKVSKDGQYVPENKGLEWFKKNQRYNIFQEL